MPVFVKSQANQRPAKNWVAISVNGRAESVVGRRYEDGASATAVRVHLGILGFILPAMKRLEINPEWEHILYKSDTQPTSFAYK